MIKFIVNPLNKLTASSPEETHELYASTAIATRYSEEFKKRSCQYHPDFISEVEVDMSKEKQHFKVIKCCCNFFRLILEKGPPFREEKH